MQVARLSLATTSKFYRIFHPLPAILYRILYHAGLLFDPPRCGRLQLMNCTDLHTWVGPRRPRNHCHAIIIRCITYDWHAIPQGTG